MHDVLIIGAGHNGLACAFYLAKKGLKVAILEAADKVGGAAVTDEFHPGFRNSAASYTVSLLQPKVIKDILVSTRPRRFALTPDGRELWVSAELAGEVNIIDVATFAVVGSVPFRPKGFRREEVTPVDLRITGDGKRAFVALGRANHVAVVDVPARRVLDYILVGNRPWGLALTSDEKLLYVANGLSDDITIIDAETLKVVTSVPVGQVPYGFLIDDR